MSHITKLKGFSATNTEAPQDITNDLDFPTGHRRSKALSTLQAAFAIAGYEMHQLHDGDYVVCNSKTTKRCLTIDGLYVLARELGAAI